MLFETKERTFLGPMGWIEDGWHYLDRSGKVTAQHVRSFLNRWVGEYPTTHRSALISRLKSGRDDDFEPATFELIIFALLKASGCAVEVEPEVPNDSGKRPDFLVTTPEGQSVYVEATTASTKSREAKAAERRVNQVYAAMDKLDCPAFAINVRIQTVSSQPPNGRNLRHFLRTWIVTIDPDEAFPRAVASQLSDLPRTVWRGDGWVIIFEAMARPPERRGLGQRVVGIQWGQAGFVNDWKPIRDAMKRKGARYGALPHPYLVAINVDAFKMDKNDELQAFFGREEVVFHTTGEGFLPEIRLKSDGVWLRDFTRVSGAWIFGGMGPWTFAMHEGTVYSNPWASKRLPSFFTRFHHAELTEEGMKWTKGLWPRDVLGLAERWPEE